MRSTQTSRPKDSSKATTASLGSWATLNITSDNSSKRVKRRMYLGVPSTWRKCSSNPTASTSIMSSLLSLMLILGVRPSISSRLRSTSPHKKFMSKDTNIFTRLLKFTPATIWMCLSSQGHSTNSTQLCIIPTSYQYLELQAFLYPTTQSASISSKGLDSGIHVPMLLERTSIQLWKLSGNAKEISIVKSSMSHSTRSTFRLERDTLQM